MDGQSIENMLFPKLLLEALYSISFRYLRKTGSFLDGCKSEDYVPAIFYQRKYISQDIFMERAARLLRYERRFVETADEIGFLDPRMSEIW